VECCPTQRCLISKTEIGEKEVKNSAPKRARVSSKHQNLMFPFGPERIHECGIATAFVILLVTGRWLMEDGWSCAAGSPRSSNSSPVNTPFSITSVHVGRVRWSSRPDVQAAWSNLSSFKAVRRTRFLGGVVGGWGSEEKRIWTNSSEEHRPKKDVRS